MYSTYNEGKPAVTEKQNLFKKQNLQTNDSYLKKCFF